MALGLALATGCAEGDAATPSFDPTTVEVMRVEAGPLVDTAVFSGQLDAEQSVTVKPEIEGLVASIEFEQGQRVEEGAVLFKLRDREQRAKLHEARASRNLARERWRRAKELLSRDASSKDRADVARAEYEMTKARVELAQVELDRTEIRAPFDGVVGLRMVDAGARVEEDTALVRIDAVDRLQVTFAISDKGLPFARSGMKVNVWVRPYPGEKFSGEVFFVSPTLDPKNRRIFVKAWIDNRDGRLAPGLFANVDLELRRVERALVVPESAVAVDQRGSYVWVVDPDRIVSRRPIEVGLRERGIVEIVRGLDPGLEIVVAGGHKVAEGDTIRVSENPIIERAQTTPAEGVLIGEGT